MEHAQNRSTHWVQPALPEANSGEGGCPWMMILFFSKSKAADDMIGCSYTWTQPAAEYQLCTAGAV